MFTKVPFYGENYPNVLRTSPYCSILVETLRTIIRTKIGRIKFLTYFDSAMPGMHLTSWNIEKFPQNLFYGNFMENVLRTSHRRHATGVTLGRFQDVPRTLLQSWKNVQQLTFSYLIHTLGELKLKILPQKCILYLCSKLTSWWRPENVTRRRSLSDLYNTSLRRFSKILKP